MDDKLFAQLLESVEQADKFIKGEKNGCRAFRVEKLEVKPEEIKGIREGLHMNQEEFAGLMMVSVGTLRGWEQGRRAPEGPAKALLKVVAKKPEAVLEALHLS